MSRSPGAAYRVISHSNIIQQMRMGKEHLRRCTEIVIEVQHTLDLHEVQPFWDSFDCAMRVYQSLVSSSGCLHDQLNDALKFANSCLQVYREAARMSDISATRCTGTSTGPMILMTSGVTRQIQAMVDALCAAVATVEAEVPDPFAHLIAASADSTHLVNDSDVANDDELLNADRESCDLTLCNEPHELHSDDDERSSMSSEHGSDQSSSPLPRAIARTTPEEAQLHPSTLRLNQNPCTQDAAEQQSLTSQNGPPSGPPRGGFWARLVQSKATFACSLSSSLKLASAIALRPNLASAKTQASTSYHENLQQLPIIPGNRNSTRTNMLMEVYMAVQPVLDSALRTTREGLIVSAELLELAPIPGLAPVAKTLVQIWKHIDQIEDNQEACSAIVRRCAYVLSEMQLGLRECCLDAEPGLGRPIARFESVLGDILADVRRITTYRPMARFLHRDEIARSITQRGADINQALDMFQMALQMRTLSILKASLSAPHCATCRCGDSTAHASPSHLLQHGLSNTRSNLVLHR